MCWTNAHLVSVASTRTPTGRAARRRRRPSAPQSLLILHVDAETLRNDGLHLGELASYQAALSAAVLGSRVELRDSATQAELLGVLAELKAQNLTFDVVVVIGHSDESGIQLGPDDFASWPEFAAHIKPLRPRRLLLVACRAGRWNAGEALFSANGRLRRIFACPVNASKDFGKMMLFAVPYVVAKRRPRDKDVLWAQFAAVSATGRQLREWRRSTDKGNPDSSIFDLIADMANPVAMQVPKAISSLFDSVIRR